MAQGFTTSRIMKTGLVLAWSIQLHVHSTRHSLRRSPLLSRKRLNSSWDCREPCSKTHQQVHVYRHKDGTIGIIVILLARGYAVLSRKVRISNAEIINASNAITNSDEPYSETRLSVSSFSPSSRSPPVAQFQSQLTPNQQCNRYTWKMTLSSNIIQS